MLTIREPQFDLLGDTAIERFLNRLMIHLREHFPEQVGTLAPAELADLCREGIA